MSAVAKVPFNSYASHAPAAATASFPTSIRDAFATVGLFFQRLASGAHWVWRVAVDRGTLVFTAGLFGASYVISWISPSLASGFERIALYARTWWVDLRAAHREQTLQAQVAQLQVRDAARVQTQVHLSAQVRIREMDSEMLALRVRQLEEQLNRYQAREIAEANLHEELITKNREIQKLKATLEASAMHERLEPCLQALTEVCRQIAENQQDPADTYTRWLASHLQTHTVYEEGQRRIIEALPQGDPARTLLEGQQRLVSAFSLVSRGAVQAAQRRALPIQSNQA